MIQLYDKKEAIVSVARMKCSVNNTRSDNEKKNYFL